MPRKTHSSHSDNPSQAVSNKVDDIVAKTHVTITINTPSINIKAETPRLILRPVIPEDVPIYQTLWADPTVMALFADGKPKLHKSDASKEAGIVDYAQNRLVDDPNSWCHRWKQGNPFSGMTVIDKSTHTAIGGIILGGGELAGFGDPLYWGKGYGAEATIILTKAILPAIALSECAANIPKTIKATAHPNNPASWKILEKIGMVPNLDVAEVEFGGEKHPRKQYEISVQDLVADYSRIKSTQSHQSGSNPKAVLPLYQLHRTSSTRQESMRTINIGGHSLRNTENRKLKYSAKA